MKQNRKLERVLVALCTCMAAITAFAAEIENYGTNGLLSVGTSWAGGVVPGAEDTAIWDGAGVAANGGWVHVLGADAEWRGLRATNSVKDTLSITNAGTETLMLGAGGISLMIPEHNNIHVPVVLTADQTWQGLAPPAASALYLYQPITGDGVLTMTNMYSSFHAPLVLPSLVVGNTTCFLRDGATARFPVTIHGGQTLCLQRPETNAWSEILESVFTRQDGILKFGHTVGNPSITAVSLQAGDLIKGQTSSDRQRGQILLENGYLLNNGGTISNNWLYLKNGGYTQTGGTLWLKNAIYAGYSDIRSLQETGSVLRVESGAVDAWRLNIGLGTRETHPGRVEIAGGEVTVVRRENGEFNGVELAAKRDTQMGIDSAWPPAGVLRVSGGVLNAYQVSFGKVMNFPSGNQEFNVADGYAAVSMSGGTMNIGTLGLGPSAAWNATTNVSVSPTAWYDVRMSGGTLGALASFTNRAVTCLSDADGGVTFRAATLAGAACDIVMVEPLTGPGGLTKTGNGTLFLNAANTYQGETVIAGGALRLNTSLPYTPAAPETLPPTTATWVADSLGLAPGTAVVAWQATNTSHNFTRVVAHAIISGSTAPVIAAAPVNGHAAVAFDGTQNALGLTGNASTPVTGATSLTLAMVMRSNAAGTGTLSTNVEDTAMLIGQSYNSVPNQMGIGYAVNGRLGGGVKQAGAASTAWAAPRVLGDGDPHVVILTWTALGEIAISVDGHAQSVTDLSGVAALAQSRMMLGNSERNRPFRGDIAEFRFYKNTAMTAAQRRALGRELAATYGAETAGYLTPEARGYATLASREIRIGVNASLDTGAGGLEIAAGQTVLGAGTVSGALRVGSGGVIVATNTAAALTVSDLVLQAGCVVRWRYGSAGAAAPIQAGDLTLPNGTVTVDVTSDLGTSKPYGTLLTYTGTLVNNGVTWNVVGGHSATRVEIDETHKVVRITTKTGTLIRLL